MQGGVNVTGLVVIEHRGFDEGFQLIDAVQAHALAEIFLDPVVGQLGGDGLFDVVQGRLKNGFLAVQVLIAVILGEGDRDVKGLAGGMADDLIFKVVNVGAAAQSQVSAAALGVAAVESNAVDAAYIVNVDRIAVRGCAVLDLIRGRKVGQHVGINVIIDVVVADLAQVGADRDVRVVVGQGDIIGGGHALEITVLVKRIGKAEISQIGVLGVRGLSAGLLGGVSRLGGRFSGLGGGGVSGIAAGRKHSGHADSHAKGCHTAEILQFHGILLSFSKLHTFLLYTLFWKSKMKLL